MEKGGLWKKMGVLMSIKTVGIVYTDDENAVANVEDVNKAAPAL